MRTYFQHLELQNIDFELLCWSMRDENFIRVKELPFNVQVQDKKLPIVMSFNFDVYDTKDIASKVILNSQ